MVRLSTKSEMEDIQIHMHVEFTATVSILKFVYTFIDALQKKIMIGKKCRAGLYTELFYATIPTLLM